MPGRRPKPTVLKELAGNPGKRALNKHEPKFAGKPTCPRELNAQARKEWRRLMRSMAASHMLTGADRAAIAIYCAAWARWLYAEAKLKAEGEVITTASGYATQNPYRSIANRAEEIMLKVATEFGMTASSRSRIQAPAASKSATDKDKPNPLRDFLARKPGKAAIN